MEFENKRKTKKLNRICCLFRKKMSQKDDVKLTSGVAVNLLLKLNNNESFVIANESVCGTNNLTILTNNYIREIKNLPFQGKLPANLKPGDVISIYAYVLPHCIRFAINLNCNANQNSDVALHVNPRFSPKYIARNSRVNGIWGEEESTSFNKFNIPRSKRILIEILISEFSFEIAFNGQHFCGFAYRMPISSIKYLEINGALLVENIEYRKVETFPDNFHLNENYYTVPFINNDSKEKCKCDDTNAISVPYTGTIQKGLPRKYGLEIHGRTKILPYAFYINLQVGGQIWPHPDIPLHINPRFNTVLGEDVLVRNTWSNGKWQNEERSTAFPFQPGEHFIVNIYREANHYSIWVNNTLCGEFQYRDKSVETVDTLYIQGDLVLYKVFLYENKS